MPRRLLLLTFTLMLLLTLRIRADIQTLDPVDVEGQPLAANVERVVRALESLGAPLPPSACSPPTESS